MDEFEKFGVSNPEELRLCKEFIDAVNITPVGYDKFSQLPDKAVVEILTNRYRNTASKIVLCNGKDVETSLRQKLLMDLTLLEHAINERPKLDLYEFNVNLIMGRESMTDIYGLIDAYKHSFDIGRVNPTLIKYDADIQSVEPVVNMETGRPYRAVEYIEEMKDRVSNVIRSNKDSRSLR